MTLEEFDEALLKWGTQLQLWPEKQRYAGENLLRESDHARMLLEEMLSLDSNLEGAIKNDVPSGIIVANIQSKLSNRRNKQTIRSLLPIRKLIGWGAMAGAGGGLVAVFTPQSVGMAPLLAIALGGLWP